jgi:hypothetical protein
MTIANVWITSRSAKRVIVALALGLSVQAFATTDERISQSSTVYFTHDSVVSGDINSATHHDIVLKQEFFPVTAVLTRDIDIIDQSSPLVHHTVNTTDTLYMISQLSGGGVGFCTIERTSILRSRRQDGSPEVRSCFVDVDSDEILDRAYVQFREDADSNPYTSNYLGVGIPLREPVGYNLEQNFDIEPIYIGFKYVYAAYAGAFLTLGVIDENDLLEVFGGPDGRATGMIIDLDGEFPQRLQLHGAEIEVISFDDGMITYRINSSISTRHVFELPNLSRR